MSTKINTLDIRSQQKLTTAIQEGKLSIMGQSERSSGAMVQTEPVPTDFVMVGGVLYVMVVPLLGGIEREDVIFVNSAKDQFAFDLQIIK